MKKTTKILSIILALVMVLSIIPIATFAADDDFVIENGVLTAYNGAGGDVVIPDGVTSIGNSAFSECQSLISVEIPDSVTSIGKEAFSYCTKLESIEIPDGVTSIAYAAFYDCAALKSVTIPGSVTSIGDFAFCWCNSLTDIYFTGTEEQRNEMNIGDYNQSFKEATIHFIAEHEHAFSEEWTTDATAHWHECTAENCNIKNYAKSTVDGIAYGAHTFVDGICTVCGAKHQHTFAKEWTTDATAHWYECTSEDCDIEDYATCGIAEAAYGEHADTNSNFYCDVCGYFDEAAAIVFYVAKFKADINDNLLPAAKCDEAREILNKAYEDLDTAATYSDVQTIYNTAKGMSGGKNSEFTSKLSSYKSTITVNLGDSPAAARDNFVENTINALENSQSIAELDKAFNNGTSQISYYKSTDANVNAFNNRINSGELSDKSIALAQEAIEKINEAKTYEEVGALSNQYHSKIDVQSKKETASAELTAIAEEKNDSRVDAIVNEALAAIDEATAVMDINDIKADAIAKIEALANQEIISITEKSDAIVGELIDLEVVIAKPVKKLQFADADGNTTTYTASSTNTVSVVNNDDGTQVWTVKLTVRHSVDEYAVKVKERSSGSWSDNTYDLKIEGKKLTYDEIRSVEIPDSSNGSILYGTHDIVITTGKEVSRVQVAYAGTTATYSKSSTKATVVEDGDTLVWTISFNFYKVGTIDYAFASRSATSAWKTSDITETIETYRASQIIY